MGDFSNVRVHLGCRSHTWALPQILKSCPQLLVGGKLRGKSKWGNQKRKVESQSGTHKCGAMKAFARVSHRQQAICWFQRNGRRRRQRRGEMPGRAESGGLTVGPISPVAVASGAQGNCRVMDRQCPPSLHFWRRVGLFPRGKHLAFPTAAAQPHTWPHSSLPFPGD